jgi:hypothetical protein
MFPYQGYSMEITNKFSSGMSLFTGGFEGFSHNLGD